MNFGLNTGNQLLTGLDFPVLKIQDFPNPPEISEGWNVASRGDDYFVITFVDADENEGNNTGPIDNQSSPAAANSEDVMMNEDNQAQGFNNIQVTSDDSFHVPPLNENSDAGSFPDAWSMNGCCEDSSMFFESNEMSMNLDTMASNVASIDLKQPFENYLLPEITTTMKLNNLNSSASFGSLDLEMNRRSFPENLASVAMDLNSLDKSDASSSLFIGMTRTEPKPIVTTAESVGEMVEKPDAGIQYELIDVSVSQSNPSSSYSHIRESSAFKVGSSTRGKKKEMIGQLKRRTKQRIPDQMKDEKYWAMRKRNTESARKCRENNKIRQSSSIIDQLLSDNDRMHKELIAHRKSIQDNKEKILLQSSSIIDQLWSDSDRMLKELIAHRKSIQDVKEKMLLSGIDAQLL